MVGGTVGRALCREDEKETKHGYIQLLVGSGSFKLPLKGGEGCQGISACSRKKRNSNKQNQAFSSRPTLVDNLERGKKINQRTGVDHHVLSIRTRPGAGSCGESGKRISRRIERCAVIASARGSFSTTLEYLVLPALRCHDAGWESPIHKYLV